MADLVQADGRCPKCGSGAYLDSGCVMCGFMPKEVPVAERKEAKKRSARNAERVWLCDIEGCAHTIPTSPSGNVSGRAVAKHRREAHGSTASAGSPKPDTKGTKAPKRSPVAGPRSSKEYCASCGGPMPDQRIARLVQAYIKDGVSPGAARIAAETALRVLGE